MRAKAKAMAKSDRRGYFSGGDVQPLPLEPKGSISRLGQDTYRRETGRDSVTGSFRSQVEAKGLSTTRTNKAGGGGVSSALPSSPDEDGIVTTRGNWQKLPASGITQQMMRGYQGRESLKISDAVPRKKGD